VKDIDSVRNSRIVPLTPVKTTLPELARDTVDNSHCVPDGVVSSQPPAVAAKTMISNNKSNSDHFLLIRFAAIWFCLG